MKRKRKKTKKYINKKHVAIFCISLAVLLAAFAAVLGISGIFTGFEYDDEEYIEPVTKETGVVNVLIAGLDKSESLTDTIMVASYDLDNDKVNILSVPRDTRMYIGTRYQKINAAYSITKNGKKNGINGTVEAITRLTGIPINYYIAFTCSAFRETIDALGGVDFDVPQNMNYDDPVQDLHIHLTKGYQHLDGDKAEQLVRFRRYPMGDIDRVKVQQSFLKAIAEQKLNASVIAELPALYKVLSEEIRTNLTVTDVAKYALNIADLSSESIAMYSLPGVANGTDYGSSYWIADMTQLADLIQNTFGFDASKITIHSADGSSASKDVKKTSATPKAAATPKATAVPKQSAEPKATETPKATATPKATEKPKQTEAPKATAAPTEKPTATEKPKETEKPTVTEKPKVNRPAANPAEE